MTNSGVVTRGARLDTCDADGCLPIHVAAILGHVDIVVYLLARGQSVDVRDGEGRTPLMLALQLGSSLDMLRLLVRMGAGLQCEDDQGNTPLHLALRSAKPGLLQAFLQLAGVGKGRSDISWTKPNHQVPHATICMMFD